MPPSRETSAGIPCSFKHWTITIAHSSRVTYLSNRASSGGPSSMRERASPAKSAASGGGGEETRVGSVSGATQQHQYQGHDCESHRHQDRWCSLPWTALLMGLRNRRAIGGTSIA